MPPDAEALLAEDDFRRLFAFFNAPDGSAPAWLTDAVRQQYRALWQQGIDGRLQLLPRQPAAPAARGRCRSHGGQHADLHADRALPTLVLWGMEDPFAAQPAGRPARDWVPQLQLQPVAGASHWLVHEQPAVLTGALALFCNQIHSLQRFMHISPEVDFTDKQTSRPRAAS